MKKVIKIKHWGARVVQPVEGRTLDFGSGREPRVMGSGPALGSALSVASA